MNLSKFSVLMLISIMLSSISIFSNVKVAHSCSWSDPLSCLSPTPPVYDPSRSEGAKQERLRKEEERLKKEGDRQAELELKEKRAKRQAEDDAINKANAETLARQEAEKIAAEEAANNIKRQEAEEELANQQQEKKEQNEKEKVLNDKKNSALIQAGGNLLKLILNVK